MDQKQIDINWLGSDYASLGPSARAALGILLNADEWKWWSSPSGARLSLDRAIPQNRRATWGGDASVLRAEEWVDRRRAVAIGQAFDDLGCRDRLWIRVARPVWDWPGGSETIDRVSQELSSLLSPERVFVEWNVNRRFRNYFDLANFGQRLVVASPSLRADAFPTRFDRNVYWYPEAKNVHIALTDSVESLATFGAAQMVVLYGEQKTGVFDRISHLRAQLRTCCVVQVLTDADNISDWLNELIWVQENSGRHLSDALQIIANRTGISCRVLASTQQFFFARGPTQTWKSARFNDSAKSSARVSVLGEVLRDDTRFLTQLPELSKVAGDRIDQVAQGPASQVQDGSPARSEDSSSRSVDQNLSFDVTGADIPRLLSILPQPPMERVLHGEFRAGGENLRTWPESGEVHIQIDIRMKSPLQRSVESFPDRRIEWREEKKGLRVHMFEVGREPVTESLDLPRVGVSSTATFKRSAGRGAVDLRFLVSDGAQVLQTARLKSAPNDPIRFFVESVVSPTYRAKKAFDVALLVNDSLGNQPSVTMIADDGTPWFSPLSEAGTHAARIDLLNELDAAVTSPKAALDSLMLSLANKGALLLRSLKRINPSWPAEPKRIQLVTQSDVFFPIEYAYEGPVPGSPKATLCPEKGGCLAKGEARPSCNIRAAKEYLCPMGFLGVSAVIERQAWRDGQEPRLWGLSDTVIQRQRIDDLGTAEFVASDKADNFKDHEVHPHPVIRIKDLEAALKQKRAPSWASWQDNVAARSPSLLVMLVHMHNQAIFVGADEGLNLAGIDATYVGDGPVVIVIGCSTGLSEVPGTSLPAILQSYGARVVVAAMTTVLGRHANRVAHDLAMQMQTAARSSNLSYVGQVVSQMRRQLLGEGLALGLSVVAFGDADIVLGKAGE